MAKIKLVIAGFLAAMFALAISPGAMAQPLVPAPTVVSASAVASPSALHWQPPPHLWAHLSATDLGLVINTADPYSVAVGAYYAKRRGIPEDRIVRLNVPLKPVLSEAEFEPLRRQMADVLGPHVQAVLLAWREPYAVACNAITSAITLGFQPELCGNTCAASKPSPYITYAGNRPFTELGMRLSMLLAARSVESARQLIDRGVAADGAASFPRLLPWNAFFVSTDDAPRNVRAPLFPPPGLIASVGVAVRDVQANALPRMSGTLIYETGLMHVDHLSAVNWAPGALADHLTSFGGLLDAPSASAQMSAIDWIESGATASYGTVSEPCNHWQKFPFSQWLLLSYLQGATAIEAYWHSVAWPGQGVFIGEPLAAPFAR